MTSTPPPRSAFPARPRRRPASSTDSRGTPARPSENTLKTYGKDWEQYGRWCRMRGTDPLPPSPELVEIYVADLVAPRGTTQTKVQSPARPLSVASIEGRLSDIAWAYARRGLASSAEVDERYVQKQLGHASAEMPPATSAAGKGSRRPDQGRGQLQQDLQAELSRLDLGDPESVDPATELAQGQDFVSLRLRDVAGELRAFVPDLAAWKHSHPALPRRRLAFADVRKTVSWK